MSEFDTRVRDALARAGDAAPPPGALADGARGRLRRRRQGRGIAIGVGLASVAALPVGLALGRDRDHPAPIPPVASDSSAPADPGWRTETWRDLTLQVPADWGYGAPDQGCTPDGVQPPEGRAVVSRPGDIRELALCLTISGCLGVSFYGPESTTVEWAFAPGVVWRYTADRGEPIYPAGSWLGRVEVGHAAAVVVAPDRATARRIVESAKRVDVDPNGCWTTAELRDSNRAPHEMSDRLSVCRYGADGWLQQSERLSAADSSAALTAVGAAPLVTDRQPCPATPDSYPEVRLTSGAPLGSATVVWAARCPSGRGVFLSGTQRELTADVMYWALSPGWSGDLPSGVPMPDQRREPAAAAGEGAS